MRRKLISIVLGIGAGVLAAASPAFAQKTAYYDHGQVVSQSKAYQAVEAQLRGKRDEIAKKLAPAVKEVEAERTALAQVTNGMDEAAIREKHGQRIGTFQRKVGQLQASQQQVNREFGVVLDLAEAKINTVLTNVLDDVAKQKRVDILQPQVKPAHYADNYDATREVLAAVDRQLSSLSIDALIAEASAAAGGAN